MSTSIDLERNYEIPETGKKSEDKQKDKKKRISTDEKVDKEDEPLPGISGTRW